MSTGRPGRHLQGRGPGACPSPLPAVWSPHCTHTWNTHMPVCRLTCAAFTLRSVCTPGCSPRQVLYSHWPLLAPHRALVSAGYGAQEQSLGWTLFEPDTGQSVRRPFLTYRSCGTGQPIHLWLQPGHMSSHRAYGWPSNPAPGVTHVCFLTCKQGNHMDLSRGWGDQAQGQAGSAPPHGGPGMSLPPWWAGDWHTQYPCHGVQCLVL